MDTVIAKLQRDRLWAMQRIAQMSELLETATIEAEELQRAIVKLGGDASEEACQEASTAAQERTGMPLGQESPAIPPSNLGFIAGGR